MLFALGYIAGVATCACLFAIVAVLRGERRVDNAATEVRKFAREHTPLRVYGAGFVEIPPDDDELARQEVIQENRAAGRDTKLSDLNP